MGTGPQVGFRVVCDRTWASLAPTSDVATRWCAGCAERVHFCATAAEARVHARRGACVALVELAPRRRRRPTPNVPPPPPGLPAMVLGRPDGDDDTTWPVVAWLVPLDGPHAGETLALDPGITTLGSAPPATIVLPDAGIAALHATFQLAHHGVTVIAATAADLYVNDERVTTFELVDNDRLLVGGTRLVFKTIG